MRADGHEHLRAVEGERDITRPVTPAAEKAASRDVVHDDLTRASRLGVVGLIRKPDDRVGVGDVDPTRILPRRVERDAERLLQALGEDLHELRLSVAVRIPEDTHAPCGRLDDEQIAVRRRTRHARVRQPGREELDAEAVGHARRRALGTRDDARAVVDGVRGVRDRQIGSRELATHAGRIRRPVALCGNPREELADRMRERGGGRRRPAPWLALTATARRHQHETKQHSRAHAQRV